MPVGTAGSATGVVEHNAWLLLRIAALNLRRLTYLGLKGDARPATHGRPRAPCDSQPFANHSATAGPSVTAGTGVRHLGILRALLSAGALRGLACSAWCGEGVMGDGW